MDYYLIFKDIHIFSVILSFILFTSRAYCLLYKSQLLENSIVKRLPHVIDSILLFSALTMLFLTQLYPGHENPWIVAKITAMILYILTGLYLFKKAKSKKAIYYSFIISVIIFMYIVHTAITKNIYLNIF